MGKSLEKKLLPKDIEKLNFLILYNFNKIESFNQMFPEKIMDVSKQGKVKYFDYTLSTKKELCYEYIDNFYKDKYRDLFLSKEKIFLDLISTIEQAKRCEQFSSAISGYKLLAELMGLYITKTQIQLEQTSLVLHYNIPSNDNTLKINEQVIGNKLLSND